VIGFDTNVLLRALLEDDAEQSQMAQRRLLELTPERPGFVATGVQLELYWVFERRYRMSREDIAALLEVSSLVFENLEALVRALHLFRTANADLSDALIAECNREQGCERTMTFDKKAAKHVPGMDLLK
jgi:predicted nucleic-acid-binding protein